MFQKISLLTTVDASVSRSIGGAGTTGNKLSGLDAVATDKSQITDAGIIIIALGTNGGNSADNVQKLLSAIKVINSTAQIYWVDTTVIGRPDYIGTINTSNRAIYNVAGPSLTPISWFKTVTPTGDPQNLTGKEIDTNGYIEQKDVFVHPTPAGVTALVKTVVDAVSGGAAGSSSGGGGCVGATSNLTGSDNEEKAFRFFISKGLTAPQAAGIVANMRHESCSVQPMRIQGGCGKPEGLVPSASLTADQLANTSLGWGIVQWTNPGKMVNPSRTAGITNPQIDTLDYQLGFLWEQLTGTGVGAIIKNTRAGNDIKLQTTATGAATSFAMLYEICKDCHDPNSPTIVSRAKTAEDLLIKLGSLSGL